MDVAHLIYFKSVWLEWYSTILFPALVLWAGQARIAGICSTEARREQLLYGHSLTGLDLTSTESPCKLSLPRDFTLQWLSGTQEISIFRGIAFLGGSKGIFCFGGLPFQIPSCFERK